MKMVRNLLLADKCAAHLITVLLPCATLMLICFMMLSSMPQAAALSVAVFAAAVAIRLICFPQPLEEPAAPSAEESVEPASGPVASSPAPLAIEIGYGVFPLVEDRKGAPLMMRIEDVRCQLSRQLGFDVPLVRITVDLSLEPNSYRIKMGGLVLGANSVWPAALIALDDGYVNATIEGRKCQDPTFGMDAIWICAERESRAIAEGYIVVDASTVIATHLKNIVGANASMLFGVEEAQMLLHSLDESSPRVLDGLASLSLFSLTAICRQLLAENVPLKDFQSICRALLRASRLHIEMDQIVDAIRQEIGGLIVQNLVPISFPLPAVTLDAELENLLVEAVNIGDGSNCTIDPLLAQQIMEAVGEAIRLRSSAVRNLALITSSRVRRPLGALLRQRFPDVTVLSFQEIPDDKSVEILTKIGLPRPRHSMAVSDANQI
jgi:flagellar biosynthesis protein FlhA